MNKPVRCSQIQGMQELILLAAQMQITIGNLQTQKASTSDIQTLQNQLNTLTAALAAECDARAQGDAQKANAQHSHPQSDIQGLVAALATKLNTSDLSNALTPYALSSALAAYATNASLAIETNARTAADSSLTTSLAGKAAVSHIHVISDVSGLQSALDSKASNALITTATSGATVVVGSKIDLIANQNLNLVADTLPSWWFIACLTDSNGVMAECAAGQNPVRLVGSLASFVGTLVTGWSMRRNGGYFQLMNAPDKARSFRIWGLTVSA